MTIVSFFDRQKKRSCELKRAGVYCHCCYSYSFPQKTPQERIFDLLLCASKFVPFYMIGTQKQRKKQNYFSTKPILSRVVVRIAVVCIASGKVDSCMCPFQKIIIVKQTKKAKLNNTKGEERSIAVIYRKK